MTKTLIQLAKALHKQLGHQREKQRKQYIQVIICSAPMKECLQTLVHSSGTILSVPHATYSLFKNVTKSTEVRMKKQNLLVWTVQQLICHWNDLEIRHLWISQEQKYSMVLSWWNQTSVEKHEASIFNFYGNHKKNLCRTLQQMDSCSV